MELLKRTLKNSPSFPNVWKDVYPFLKGKIVVAHNTSFHMFALKHAFDDYEMEYPTISVPLKLERIKNKMKADR